MELLYVVLGIFLIVAYGLSLTHPGWTAMVADVVHQWLRRAGLKK